MRNYRHLLMVVLVAAMGGSLMAADTVMPHVEERAVDSDQSVTDDSDPISNWMPRGPIDMDSLLLVPIDGVWGPLLSAIFGRPPEDETPSLTFVGAPGETVPPPSTSTQPAGGSSSSGEAP